MRPVGLAMLSLSALADTSADREGPRRIRGFLISEQGLGIVCFSLEGTERWRYKCNPYDATLLRDGTLLIAERSAGRVLQVDPRSGKILWEKGGLEQPTDVERLANGRTLVVENGSGRVLELGAGGEVRRLAEGCSNPFDVCPLATGGVVVADSGHNRLACFDRGGRLAWELKDLAFPNSVQAGPAGRLLYTTYTSGGAYDVDREGKVHWKCEIQGTVYSAAWDGSDYWVSDGVNGRVFRVDRRGEVRQEIRLGRPFVDCEFLR
jgi:outer membrane protein assembly factor BamB